MTFQVENRGNGIKWVQINRQNMHNISKWCKDHECGKQVNMRTISFKSEEELTVFLLRWQGQIE
jgi:hypothetical protein